MWDESPHERIMGANTMLKGIRFRAYPTKEQENLINQTLGCCRLIFNKGLALRENAFKQGDKADYKATSAMLTSLKKQGEFSFLKEVDSIALQQSLRDLDTAYKNFFQHRADKPVFKSKHNNRQSYRTINQRDNIRIEGNRLKLPKLGYVKIKQSMEVGHIHNVTVERTPTDKYFVILNVDFEPNQIVHNSNAIGIDVGIKTFYSDSNENVVSNPKYLEKSLKKLAREQRRLSRKKKGSNNRNKQRKKVALIYEKITNQRDDFLQKQSTKLIRENQTICIEDLKIANMLKNHKLAKHISSVSWRKFFTMLEYKAKWYGNTIVKVPTVYPSSQTCSICGYKNKLVKDLSVRKWECPVCHTEHERDYNASINILNKGLQMQSA